MIPIVRSNMGVLNWWTLAISVLGLAAALPIQDAPVAKRAISELPRLVIYYQTTHDSAGNPISMLPLVQEQGIALTHLIVCSFHISTTSVIHLNDYPPDDARFQTLWNETIIMKNSGVKVMGMVGGAAAGSFSSATLDAPDNATFETYYGQLHDTIQQYGLQGMDLDVEQSMSQSGITRLVARLNADFGDDFIITLAPVASALENGGNLSGFDYETLEAAAVSPTSGLDMIDFLNAQFYSGFGTMASSSDFERIVANGWDPAEIVAGQLTAPSNGGGYTAISSLNATVVKLVETYGTIGGIMGWEYFNSDPGGLSAPWEWAQEMTQILRPNDVVELTVTDEAAAKLEAAWVASVVPPGSEADGAEEEASSASGGRTKSVKVDYFAMVNA